MLRLPFLSLLGTASIKSSRFTVYAITLDWADVKDLADSKVVALGVLPRLAQFAEDCISIIVLKAAADLFDSIIFRIIIIRIRIVDEASFELRKKLHWLPGGQSVIDVTRKASRIV